VLTRRSATVLGTRIEYWCTDRGSSQDLLLLHGLGGDHSGLRELAHDLHGVNIIAPDLPGFGASEPLRVPHTLENYAHAVEELRRQLGLDACHVLGHSLGASIALVHAGTYPTAARTLCLVNPVSMTRGFAADLGKLYYRIGAMLPHRLARPWLTSRPAVYLSNSVVLTTRDRARRRSIMRQDYLNYRRASTRAMVESFLSYYDIDVLASAAAVRAETLLITGNKDGIAPPHSVALLRDAIPRSHLTVFPDAGHLLPLEQPSELAGVVNEFLSPVLGMRTR
jgi:pimeloyl-ACP methyl ester carboxylesterase